MAETRTTLSSTWQQVFNRGQFFNELILGDPAQAGDVCWTTDAALNTTTTAGGVPLGIATSFDNSSLPAPTIYARSPSGAVLTVLAL